MAVLAQLFAQPSGSAVLPDDGRAGESQRLAVPQHDGFALVRDAEAGGSDRGGVEASPTASQRGGPDLLGIVLDPPGLREMLGELAVAA